MTAEPKPDNESSSSLGEKIAGRLSEFAEALETNNLKGFRVTKLIRNDDGSFSRIVTTDAKFAPRETPDGQAGHDGEVGGST